MKEMKRKNSKKRAFTIVELIIVIAVIGVLAAILIPAFTNMIVRANAKSALSDARNSLTAFLAENLAVVDGQLASSIVIFVEKANQFYVFGYATSGDDVGKLMQSAGNPFKYKDLAELIEERNCPESELGTPTEADYAFYLRTTPSGTGTKTKSMDEINNTYINISEHLGDVLPKTSEVFDGLLVGTVLDGTVMPSDGGTNPGGAIGGGSTPGGGTEVTVTFDPNTTDEVTNMPPQETLTYDAYYEIPNNIPEREGYIFDGWECDGFTYNGGAVISNVKTNMTFLAKWELDIEYTLTFDPDGGALVLPDGFVNGSSYQNGTDISNIVINTQATKAGFNFSHWSDGKSEYTSDYSGAIRITGDLVLTAVWQETKYIITYDLDGGTGMSTDGGSHSQGANVTLPVTVPTKSGFAFNGWLCSVMGTIYNAGATYQMPGADSTLTAQWANEYTVHYEKNSGEGTVPADTKYPIGTQITLAAGLTRDNFTFSGWLSSVSGEGTLQPNEAYTVNNDVTFTAQWQSVQYYVTYAGTNAPSDTKGYAAGEEVTVKDITGQRAGYEFMGYEASHGGILQVGDKFAMPQGGTTLTALWVKLSKLTLVIEGTTNNGMTLVQDPSKIVNGSSFVKEYLNVAAGADIYDYLFPATKLSYAGELYLFRGWVNADNHAITYGEAYVGAINMPDGDATFIVAWEGNPYEISFNLNGGSGSFSTIEFFPGDNVTIPATKPTIAGGQVFSGWERSDSGIIIAAGGTIVSAPANNIELKALWANPEFTIEFDLQGGSSGPENLTVPWEATGTYTIPATVPSKAGHTFLHWASTLGGTILPGGEIDLSKVTVGSTVTLTAAWQPYQWHVTYDANGGTGTTNDATEYNHGTEVTVMANGFTYAGFKFLGWNTSADGEGTSYAAGDKFNITEHTTLYAQWEVQAAQEYTITFAMQDAFNNEAAGNVEVKVQLASGDEFVINAENFAEHFAGYKPYDATSRFAATYTKTITAGEETAIDGGTVSVYGYVTVGSDEYIKITTKAGFDTIATDVTHMGKKYQLQNNITTAVTAPLGLGKTANQFTGTFDGNDKSIAFSYQSTAASATNVGLFSFVGAAGKVENLTVTFGTIRGYANVGALVGYNNGTISRCKVSGTNVNGVWTDGYTNVGGFVGANGGTINHSSSNTTVTNAGGDCTGGFVGVNHATGVILNSHHTGNVTGSATSYYVGGFAGDTKGKIQWSSTKGTTVTGRQYLGGFVGSASGTIEYCSSEWADVTRNNTSSGAAMSGFCGFANGLTIRNSYARVTTRLTGNTINGGFAVIGGNSNTITNCYLYLEAMTATVASSRFDIWVYGGTISRSNCYIKAPSTSYLNATYQFTFSTNDAGIKTNTSGNTAWVNAGCWDFSGAYVKLMAWGDLYGTATVTFDANLEGVTSPEEIAVESGKNITLPTLTDPSDEYVFLGWSTSSTATTAQHAGGASYKAQGNVTLYGVWLNKNQEYTLTLNANAPAGCTPEAFTDSVTQKVNTNFTLPTLSEPTGNFQFTGWAKTAGGNPTYAGGDTLEFTENVTLYARWKIGVKFEINSSSVSASNPETMFSYANTSITVPTPTDGNGTYQFVGWTTTGSTTNYSDIVATGGASYTVTSPVTLKGFWVESGTPMIIYLEGTATGAADIPSATEVTGGNGTIASSIPKLIPADASMTKATAYSFNYWTKAGSSTKYYPGDSIPVSGVTILTANWTTGCYAIRSVADYNTLATLQLDGKLDCMRNYVLANNLSLAGSSTIIGSNDEYYSGTFNGNGYTLSNLTISSGYKYTAMFAHMGKGATVQYLNIDNFNLHCGTGMSSGYAAIICANYDNASGGYAYMINVTISNCSATGGTDGFNGIWSAYEDSYISRNTHCKVTNTVEGN